jgi:ATP-dependent helicase HrpB
VFGHKDREERNTPEIQRSDLAEVVLLLHSLGIREASTFDWLDKPDPQAVQRAERLLTMLGALLDAELTPIGHQMRRLPMHPRYSRMLIEASQRGCLADAALCAALVSGRDLLARLDRDDVSTQAAREMFEDSTDSDFITLMRAYDFAKANGFSFDRCRSYGINAQVARQVEQTFQQIMHAAQQQRLDVPATQKSSDALLRCLMAGFVDQLAKRRTPGKPECDLTDQRTGQLVRESVVTDAAYFVAANLRETPSRQTLLSLATAVQPAWIAEMFPQHLSTTIEHLFDAQNKRVAAMRLVRYRDLVIEQKAQQRDLDPVASGRCLAEAHRAGAFDLPLMDHRLKQFIARVKLVHATLPELEFAPFDEAALTTSLARAFTGLTLVKEAQAAPLLPAFHQHLDKGQVSWLDELVPLTLPWPSGGTIKLSYVNDTPEAQVKLQDCFAITAHPTLCEGRLPVTLSLHTPDGKRLVSTTDWPKFQEREWPKHRQAVAKKFPSIMWR